MKDDNTSSRTTPMVTGIAGAVILVWATAAAMLSSELTTIRAHQLHHAWIAVGAGLLALGLAARLPKLDRERSGWCILAVVAPAVGLLLMWPTTYAYLMGQPWLNVLVLLVFALCSFLAVFAAQAYVRGLGWPMLVLLVGMDAAAAGGFGVSPGPSELLSPPPAAAAGQNSATEIPAAPGPLHVLGKQLAQDLGCAACHHPDGTEGIGPTWKNLAGYPQKLADGTTAVADYAFLKSAVLHPERLHLNGFPQGVMPSTYREMLSGPQHADEHKLNALIWYINTLSDRSSPASQPPVPDEPKK